MRKNIQEMFKYFEVVEVEVKVITPTMMPPWATPEMSVHRNVLVIWDEDNDPRILEWLDMQPCEIIKDLLLASEHEGSLYLIWKHDVPNDYKTDCQTSSRCGDVWSIYESRVG